MSSEKKLEEIAEDLQKELNAGLVFLSEKVVEGDRSLCQRWFNLEFGVTLPCTIDFRGT